MALAPIGPIAVTAPVSGLIENRVVTSEEYAFATLYSPVVVEPKVPRLWPFRPPMRVRFALLVLIE